MKEGLTAELRFRIAQADKDRFLSALMRVGKSDMSDVLRELTKAATRHIEEHGEIWPPFRIVARKPLQMAAEARAKYNPK